MQGDTIQNEKKNSINEGAQNNFEKLSSQPNKQHLIDLNSSLKKKAMRIVNFKETQLSTQESSEINLRTFYKSGLNKETEIKGAIALRLPSNKKSNSNSSLHHHTFEKITKKRDPSISYFDFPRFVKNAPESFSAFMTESERKKVENYVKNKKDDCKSVEAYADEEKESIREDSVPYKNVKYCHFCRVKFDDYNKHLTESGHLIASKLPAVKQSYSMLSETFEKVRQYWREKQELESINNNLTTTYSETNPLSATGFEGTSSLLENTHYNNNKDGNDIDFLKSEIRALVKSVIANSYKKKKETNTNTKYLSQKRKAPSVRSTTKGNKSRKVQTQNKPCKTRILSRRNKSEEDFQLLIEDDE